MWRWLGLPLRLHRLAAHLLHFILDSDFSCCLTLAQDTRLLCSPVPVIKKSQIISPEHFHFITVSAITPEEIISKM